MQPEHPPILLWPGTCKHFQVQASSTRASHLNQSRSICRVWGVENGNTRLVCIRGEDIIKSRDPLCRAQVQRTVTSCICRQGRRKYIDWWVFSFSNWYDFVFREENILPHCMCHTSSVEWNTLVYIFHMLRVAGGYVRFFFGSARLHERRKNIIKERLPTWKQLPVEARLFAL